MADRFSVQRPPVDRAGRDVVWQLLDGVGLEHCRFRLTDAGPLLSGTVVTSDAGEPVTIAYAVLCDRQWHTREVTVDVDRARPTDPASLHLVSDGDGRWWRVDGDDRTPLPGLSGCIDIDLAVTPATNTLPIRRIDMVPGAKARVTAAWLQFPSLEVTPLAQEYRRLDRFRYRYQSLTHGFAATLEIDDLGLVRDYEGVWARIAQADLVSSEPGA